MNATSSGFLEALERLAGSLHDDVEILLEPNVAPQSSVVKAESGGGGGGGGGGGQGGDGSDGADDAGAEGEGEDSNSPVGETDFTSVPIWSELTVRKIQDEALTPDPSASGDSAVAAEESADSEKVDPGQTLSDFIDTYSEGYPIVEVEASATVSDSFGKVFRADPSDGRLGYGTSVPLGGAASAELAIWEDGQVDVGASVGDPYGLVSAGAEASFKRGEPPAVGVSARVLSVGGSVKAKQGPGAVRAYGNFEREFVSFFTGGAFLLE